MNLFRLYLNFIQVAAVTKKITNDSGILSLLESGDSIMADRGSDIENDLPPSIKLNIPLFLQGNTRLELKGEFFVNDDPLNRLFTF